MQSSAFAFHSLWNYENDSPLLHWHMFGLLTLKGNGYTNRNIFVLKLKITRFWNNTNVSFEHINLYFRFTR